MEPLQSELLEAVRIEYIEYIEALLSQGVDPNFENEEEYSGTSLLSAVIEGRIEIIRLLLLAGAKVSFSTSDGDTPLHCAASRKTTTLLHLLLDSGQSFNLDGFDSSERTPLMRAVEDCKMEHAKMLLQAGANVNSRYEEMRGHTALGLAMERCDLDMVKLLLHSGANLYALGFLGTMPIEAVALRKGKNAEIIRTYLLEKHPECKRYLIPPKKRKKR